MATAPGPLARELDRLDLPALASAGVAADAGAVDRALATPTEPASLAVLLGPAAGDRLETLAGAARAVTLQRFGRAVRLFAPLYVSNACLSTCTYCGFSRGLEVARRTLTVEEVASEAQLLADRGLRSLLLVSGEHRLEVSPDYLVGCVQAVAARVPSVSVETQTWSAPVYERLVAAGCEGLVCFQETYDRATYAERHRAGWKRDFDRRLIAVDDAAAAGMRRIGLGTLLGLRADWRADVLALAAHARSLQRRFWRTEITVTLPRLKPSASGFSGAVEVDDRTYTQALAALRLALPDVGIVLSTREPPRLRDGLARIAATTLSAGSRTEPGGYSDPGAAQEQFSIDDDRSPAEVAAALSALGYEPVWKDAFPLAATAAGL